VPDLRRRVPHRARSRWVQWDGQPGLPVPASRDCPPAVNALAEREFRRAEPQPSRGRPLEFSSGVCDHDRIGRHRPRPRPILAPIWIDIPNVRSLPRLDFDS
jgi:hypothetical protein